MDKTRTLAENKKILDMQSAGTTVDPTFSLEKQLQSEYGTRGKLKTVM